MQAAVAAIAFLKFDEGFEKTGAIEVGPQSFANVHFGVSNLPEEEIANAHFAAGADKQVWIGQAFSVEVAGNFFFGDAGGMAVLMLIGVAVGVRALLLLGIAVIVKRIAIF